MSVEAVKPELLNSGVVLVSELAAPHELEELSELSGSSKELGYHAVLVEVRVGLVHLGSLVHLSVCC